MSSFHRILIANRGEIACRVIRTARALGYETVAVYSDADAEARHVQLADVAVHIGPALAASSYLSIDKLIDAAKTTGADAIHPGYGFLAENADFAAACDRAGLVFIGPSAEVIRVMGAKRGAKILMRDAGVPVVPGYVGTDQDLNALMREAEQIGPPLLIKASAGGGGRGMRLLTDLSDLRAQLEAAGAEAQAAFGDAELILERAVIGARHVEIQVFADTHGHVIHLGERDCSVQRRHQKVIEEAPSPAVDAALRQRMGEAAVLAARSVGYVGAGTVEFLLDQDGAFYFIEMNTRLQVEHPVTEMITGFDLVAWQIDVAAGRPLPVSQQDLRLDGHAIEVRLYAEDPDRGYLPQVGRVERFVVPEGDGVRIDHGLLEGQQVTADYDPMLAKVVAWGRDRSEACRRLVRALRQTILHGVVVNQAFLIEILQHSTFAEGQATTDWLEQLGARQPAAVAPESAAVGALLALDVDRQPYWHSTGGAAVRIKLAADEEMFTAKVTPRGTGNFSVEVMAQTLEIRLLTVDGPVVRYARNGVIRRAFATRLTRSGGTTGAVAVSIDGRSMHFERRSLSEATGAGPEGEGTLRAPMAGRVVAVSVQAEATVERGDVVVVLEAMKMRLELRAPRSGRVAEVKVAEGEQVASHQALVHVE